MSDPTLYHIPAATRGLLQTIKAVGFRVFGVSNQELALATKLESAFGLDTLLDRLFVSDAVGFAKPDSRFFTAVLSATNTAAADAAFIGNNPVNDMRGAANAGIPVRILLDYDDRFQDDPLYFRVHNPNDVFPYLQQFAASRS